MNRRERILHYIKTHQSVKTIEIAEELCLQRENVSRLLNQMVREGVLTKTATRPVVYSLSDGATSEVQVREPDSAEKKEVSYAFDRITGNRGSMKTPIEQAKAAILYPPRGLNCLITGQTGTGKTLFAYTMFQFAKDHNVIDQNKELTVFNCADYANNPELLMSHLFGYVKGAFTGATETTNGLIQQADGGMLFLDEVHRLPPEGQEMIFYFMDHGTYSRLGEVEKKNKANVRIVCATTEEPSSNLLSTFMRRIPITIQLPNYHERPALEQIELLRTMLQLEASRINRCFSVSEDVVKALIGSVDYGNVGQLKSNVQLVCARGFLNYMDRDVIPLTTDALNPMIKEGIVRLASNRPLHGEISRHLEREMMVKPTDTLPNMQQDAYELPYNLYEIIGDKAAVLKDEGLDQEAINHFITTDINVHLKTFYQASQNMTAEQKLTDIVDQEIIDLTKEIRQFVVNEMHYDINDHFLYAMSLHISSFIKRMQSGKDVREVSKNLESIVANCPTELRVAERISRFLEEHYHIMVPTSETYYLATLLVSLKTSHFEKQHISIIVAAHGNSTASSMVQVVTKLLNVEHLAAFDMSLDMKPQEALEGIVNIARHMEHDHGIILLVDMGSLATLGPQIGERLNCEVKTIDMVTTAMVLEAARKTTIGDLDLDLIYKELCDFKGYSRTLSPKKANKKAILAICSTGEGTAKKIKDIIDDMLVDMLIDDIEVLPLSVVSMDKDIQVIQSEYQIIGATGIKAPPISVPFMTLEDLLKGEGEHFIKSLNNDIDTPIKSECSMNQMIAQYLEENAVFLNPKKALPVFEAYLLRLEEHLMLTDSTKISLSLHLSGMIERLIQGNTLTADAEELLEWQGSELYRYVQEANTLLENTFNLVVSSDETYYITQIIDTESTQKRED